MMYGFNLLFWIAGLIAWKRPIDLLPVVSISLAIFRFEKTKKGTATRHLIFVFKPERVGVLGSQSNMLYNIAEKWREKST